MIRTSFENNAIRVHAVCRQTLDIYKMKQLFRSCLRLIQQHGVCPIIIDTDRNLKIDNDAVLLFKKFKHKITSTIVIISG